MRPSVGAVSERARAYVALVVATALWAGNFIVGKYAIASMSPFSIAFLRWALALAPLLATAQLVERPDWREVARHWLFLLVQGVLGLFAYNLLLYAALRTSTPFSASLINAANPALIALAALVVLRERIGVWGGVGIGLSLLGVLIVLTQGRLGDLLATRLGPGDALMLLGIGTWTVYTVAARRGPRIPPITQVAAEAALVVVPLAVAAPFVGVTFPDSGAAWGSLAFIALFPSCVAYVLWNRALIVVPSGRTGVFLNLITVFTAVWALIAGTPISAAQVVGGCTIVAGVVLTTLPSRPRQRALARPA